MTMETEHRKQCVGSLFAALAGSAKLIRAPPRVHFCFEAPASNEGESDSTDATTAEKTSLESMLEAAMVRERRWGTVRATGS